MSNIKIIGVTVVAVAVVGFAAMGGAPDVSDNGGFFEGGSMSEDSVTACNAACDALANEIKELKDRRAKELFEGAGCSEGSGGDWTGTIVGGYQFTCPSQSAAEALGDAIGDMKNNPGDLDKKIDNLEQQHEDNCPCTQTPPGGMVRVAPPYLIICPNGASLSGTPLADENGNPILDANGNYIDSSTGASVVCP